MYYLNHLSLVDIFAVQSRFVLAHRLYGVGNTHHLRVFHTDAT